MLVRLNSLIVIVLVWSSLPVEAQDSQEAQESQESQDLKDPHEHKLLEVNLNEAPQNKNALMHVIAICGANDTEAERSFRQTACQIGYNSVMVVHEKCVDNICDFYSSLQNHLKSLPRDDYALIADTRSSNAYLMASPRIALEQLKPWQDQLILAHPPLILKKPKDVHDEENQKEKDIDEDSSKDNDNKTSKERENELNNLVETDKTTMDEVGAKAAEDEFQEEANRVKRALNGGSAIGVISSIIDGLLGKNINTVFNDTISQHVHFGDYKSGSVGMGIDPVRVKFVPFGAQEEDATTPILSYNINDNNDFYNIIQVGSEVEENQCSYEAHIQQNSIYPSLLVMITLGGKWSPFLEEVFQGLLNQKYPKESMDIRIINNFGVNEKEVSAFLFESTNLYRSIQVIDKQEQEHIDLSSLCATVSCDAAIIMSPRALLETDDVIANLLGTKRLMVAPLLKTAYKGKEVNYVYNHKEENGQWDQLIRDRTVRSIVKVAEVKAFVLVHRTVLDGTQTSSAYLDARQTVGYLVDPRGGHEGKLHQNLWGVKYNRNLWIRRYIQSDLIDIIKKKKKPEELGHYMFHVPFFTERFCREMIEEMEHHGDWFDDTEDKREISHQYTSRNINLEDLGYKEEYMVLMNSVHKELLSTLYNGFRSKPEASLMFVLKYSPDKEYGTFKYHLDGASYTYNIALNNEFTGGGLQFKMGNPNFGGEKEFIIPHNRTGWAVIQPNRPLHYHRGVPLTTGTRYAMINIVETSCSGCKGGPLF